MKVTRGSEEHRHFLKFACDVLNSQNVLSMICGRERRGRKCGSCVAPEASLRGTRPEDKQRLAAGGGRACACMCVNRSERESKSE